MREVKAHFDALGTRLDDKDLLTLADAPEPQTRAGGRRRFSPEGRAAIQFIAKKYQFFRDEGAAVLIDPVVRGWRNDFCSIGHSAAAVG